MQTGTFWADWCGPSTPAGGPWLTTLPNWQEAGAPMKQRRSFAEQYVKSRLASAPQQPWLTVLTTKGELDRQKSFEATLRLGRRSLNIIRLRDLLDQLVARIKRLPNVNGYSSGAKVGAAHYGMARFGKKRTARKATRNIDRLLHLDPPPSMAHIDLVKFACGRRRCGLTEPEHFCEGVELNPKLAQPAILS